MLDGTADVLLLYDIQESKYCRFMVSFPFALNSVHLTYWLFCIVPLLGKLILQKYERTSDFDTIWFLIMNQSFEL